VGPPPYYCVVSRSVLFVNKSPNLVHLPLKKVSSFFNMCWLNYFLVDVCFMVTVLPRTMHCVLVVLIPTKISVYDIVTLCHIITWWLYCMKSWIATPIAKGFFVHRLLTVLHGPQKIATGLIWSVYQQTKLSGRIRWVEVDIIIINQNSYSTAVELVTFGP